MIFGRDDLMARFNQFKAFCIEKEAYLHDPPSNGSFYHTEDYSNLEAEAAKCSGMDIILTEVREYKGGNFVNRILPLTVDEYKEKYPNEWHFFGRGMFNRPSSLDNLFVVDSAKKEFVDKMMSYKDKLKDKVSYPNGNH